MSSKSKIIISIITILIIITGIISYLFLIKQDFKIKTFEKEISISYGEDFDDKIGNICYGNKISCKKVTVSSAGEIDTKKVGTYEKIYTYKYKNKTIKLKQIIKVEDKEQPKIIIDKDNLKVCPNGKIISGNIEAEDNADGNITNKIITKYDNNRLNIEVEDSNGNKAIENIDISATDNEAPKIILKGSDTVYITTGDKYNDESAKVIDNCDSDINLITTNNVNTNRPGTYIIKYEATDSSNNKSTVKRTIIVSNKATNHVKPTNIKKGARKVYLTFDDGPGQYTGKLLDILKKYNVKATFFVTGKGSDALIKREYDEGHTVALHTWSHDYPTVYRSVNSYFNDLYKIQNRVKRITGYESKIIRFPGGSSNTVSRHYDGGIRIMSVLSKEVQNRGFYYFDWNCSSGDAAGKPISSTAVYNNVIRGLKEDYTVVLQHDIKGFSVDAVERIIQYGIANGYTFERLTESSPGAHHGINN